MKKLFAVALLGLALAGCAQSAPSAPEPQESSTDQPVVTAPAPEPSEPALNLPEGYPHIVPISEIPEHMRWAFEATGTGEAVAIAPGVWAELGPGATMEDAVRAGSFSGFCSSVEAFEREYRDGASSSGMCW